MGNNTYTVWSQEEYKSKIEAADETRALVAFLADYEAAEIGWVVRVTVETETESADFYCALTKDGWVYTENISSHVELSADPFATVCKLGEALA